MEEIGPPEHFANNLVNTGDAYLFEGAINPQGEYPCYRDPTTGHYIQTAACTLTTPVGSPSFSRNYRYNDGAAYIQDTYKATPRLTINGGVRWEYYGVQHNANSNLDSNFVMGPGADPWDRIRNGQVELVENGGYFWKPNYGNFGPRTGFAWDPTGSGKTSIRGGYSLSFERNFGNVTYNAIQNPPNFGVVSIQGEGADVVNLPIYTSNAGPLAGSGVAEAFPGVSLRAINQNVKPPISRAITSPSSRRSSTTRCSPSRTPVRIACTITRSATRTSAATAASSGEVVSAIRPTIPETA